MLEIGKERFAYKPFWSRMETEREHLVSKEEADVPHSREGTTLYCGGEAKIKSAMRENVSFDLSSKNSL